MNQSPLTDIAQLLKQHLAFKVAFVTDIECDVEEEPSESQREVEFRMVKGPTWGVPRKPPHHVPESRGTLIQTQQQAQSSNCVKPTKMRTLLNLSRPIVVCSRHVSRCYSSQASSLVKIHDIPSPSSGRIRILSLSRPEARNAISRQLLQELGDAVRSIDSEYDRIDPTKINGLGASVEASQQKTFGGAAGVDAKAPTRSVILASEVDSCFCAGSDLKERKGMSESEYVPRLDGQEDASF